MSATYTAAMGAIAEMADRMGVVAEPSIWRHAWSHDGRAWLVEVNRASNEMDGIPPVCARVTCDGWPAGVFSPFVGLFAAHETVNEDTFIAACEAEG